MKMERDIKIFPTAQHGITYANRNVLTYYIFEDLIMPMNTYRYVEFEQVNSHVHHVAPRFFVHVS